MLKTKKFYAENIEKYSKRYESLYEWLAYPEEDPFEENKKHHICIERKDGYDRTKCGREFPSWENRQGENDLPKLYLVGSPSEEIEQKCVDCLRELWEEKEKELDKKIFSEDSLELEIEIGINEDNIPFVREMIENYGIDAFREVFNGFLYYEKDNIRNFIKKRNINSAK